ncbi:MAG: DEAD/DEAH box helicase [Clostridia bacterium]
MNYHEQLSASMRNTLELAGYTIPTPIQEKSLTDLLAGRDLIGIAQTGTGKTAAFAVPMVERIYSENTKTQALILCPTRELALQTTEVLRKMAAHKRLRVISVYGGQAPNIQIRALRAGAQIVVGTPGRVKDMIERNVLKLKNVRQVVLDEADEMLDFGFLPDIKWILSCVTDEHQTMLFSATMSKAVEGVARTFLHNPTRIEVGEVNEPTKTVQQMCIKTDEGGKLVTVNQLMKQTSPRLTLIFCNTRRRVKSVTQKLNENGLATACLHGDLSQNQRDSIMRSFRAGKTPVLVATDVAARGLDVDNVDLVINYDVPDKPEYYVHRIGRTGRAGHQGLACTLVSGQDNLRLMNIKRRYHVLMA